MNILLVCSAGMSTSIVVKKMQEAAKLKGIEANIWAVGEAQAKDNVSKCDIVMLGPQVRFIEAKMKEMVKNLKPVVVIDMLAYGRLDGLKVLDQALTALKI